MKSRMKCPRAINKGVISASWKKVSNTFCNKVDVGNIISPDMLKSYIKTGWADITDTYKDIKDSHGFELLPVRKPDSPGKERTVNLNPKFGALKELEQTLALEMLGSIRKYLVERMFRCASGNFSTCDHEYVAFGSTNITSDYDLSIMGPKSNDIMWNMFKQFLNHYGHSLPYALDSNMYCGPIYIHTTPNKKKLNINPNLKNIRVDFGDRTFTFIPHNDDDLNEQLYMACIKLIPLKHLLPENSKLFDKYITTAEKYKLYFDDKKKENQDKQLEEVSKGHNDPLCLELIRDYYLQYLNGSVCANHIYNNKPLDGVTIDGKEKTNLFFYLGQESYYSSEAYYTSAAVNCVVVEMQRWKNKKSLPWDQDKRPSKIKIYSYLTAALENLGDLYNHSHHEKGEVKKIIIKYSKYLYRIYNILGKIQIGDYAAKAKKIEEKVIPLRATYNMVEAEKYWDLLDYKGEDKQHYIDKICSDILIAIENKMSEKKKGGRKKRKTIKKRKVRKRKRSKRKKR
jgi:hypothetical protein